MTDTRDQSGANARSGSLLEPVLVLWGLLGIGISQPILDLYGKNPEAFIAGRSSAGRIVVFALAVTFIPVLVAAALLFVARLMGPRVATPVYRLLLFGAAFTAVSALVHQLLPDSELALGLAALGAILIVLVEARRPTVQSYLRLLALMPIVALALFLGASKSSELIWKPEASADDSALVGNPAPVVMLVFDELPLTSLVTAEGQINEALFPNFARLAEQSHWFENAQSNSIATTDSVPILLTGRLAEGASPTSRDHPQNLFTMLGSSYEMDVQETITTLCPADLCSTTDPEAATEGASNLRSLLLDASVVWGHVTQPPRVRARLPAIDGQWGGFVVGAGGGEAASDVPPALDLPLPPPDKRSAWTNKFLRMIANVDDFPTNTVHYTHVIAPHIPWQSNPSGTGYERPEDLSTAVAGVEGGYWLDDPPPATQGFQRHLFQLGLVDRMLGLLLDELDRSGLWDDAIFVATADHGASFTPGDHRRWVTPTNLDDLYRVPLFIHTPGQTAGEIHTANAYLKDVLPTIVDLLDVRLGPEWTFEGQSLFGPDLPAERAHEYDHFTGHREALGGSVAGLLREAAESRQLIADQSSWKGVAAVGPYAELVGAPLAALDPRRDREVVAQIDEADQYADLDPNRGTVPTVLTGRITVPPQLTTPDVLIAVNGSVWGAGFTIRDTGDTRTLRAIVPEEAYRSGPNEVSVLVPDVDGTWIEAATGSVGGPSLLDDDGVALEIAAPRDRKVVIDGNRVSDGELHLRGWSADTVAKEAPSEILVYFGEELAYEGPPNLVRSDVPRWFKSEELARTGFELDFPMADIPEEIERVTVVGRFTEDAVLEYATIPR